MKDEIRVAKRCPHCGQRVFDKISLATGFIEMKCPRCEKKFTMNLALRRKNHYQSYGAYQRC